MLTKNWRDNIHTYQVKFSTIGLMICAVGELLVLLGLGGLSGISQFSGFFTIGLFSGLLGFFSFNMQFEISDMKIYMRAVYYLEICVIFGIVWFIADMFNENGTGVWHDNSDRPIFLFIFLSMISLYMNIKAHRGAKK